MPSTDRATGAPPAGAVSPPADQLRTERHDWLLVGYESAELSAAETPEPEDADVFCAKAPEVPALVGRWRAREDANHKFPRLWLAPRLRPDFAAAIADANEAQHAAWRANPGPGAARAAVWNGLDTADIAADEPAPDPLGGLPDFDGAFEGRVLVGGREASGEERRVMEDDLRTLWRAGRLPFEGTGAGLRRRASEALADGLLYAPEATAGGYVYVLTHHDAARRRRLGEPELATLDGKGLRPATGPLPAPAAELMAYVRRHIENRYPDAKGVAPTDAQVAAFLRKRAFEDATPRAPEPDARVANKVEDAVAALAARSAAGRGPVAEEVARRVRKRRETVDEALAWLVRCGRLTGPVRADNGRLEYLPPVSER